MIYIKGERNMNKMYNVLTSTALLGALVIGQSSIASATETTSKTEEIAPKIFIITV